MASANQRQGFWGAVLDVLQYVGHNTVALFSKNILVERSRWVYEEFGDDGLRDLLTSGNTGIGVVAGLIATISFTLLFSFPTMREDNDYNEPARFFYVFALLSSTFLNLSAVAISFESLKCMSVPVSEVFNFDLRAQGNPFLQSYVHLYLSLYCLWGACCSALYLMHGPTFFWIGLGYGIAFICHLTYVANFFYAGFLKAYRNKREKKLGVRGTGGSSRKIVPVAAPEDANV